MAVELIIAPPASGKTTACIQRIRALISERRFAPVRVVLPDRLQTAAFRGQLAQAGGSLGVQVGTFGDLYAEILELAGWHFPVASPPMVHRLVQLSIDQVNAAGMLQHYAGLRETPGFALALRDVFAELKRSLVFPDAFTAEAEEGSQARQELALLYGTFQAKLRDLDWADPEGVSWLAVEVLEKNPALPVRLDLLVVDGFDSFTGAQMRALQLLEPVVRSILVTLPGELPFTRIAHRRFSDAFQDLSTRLNVTARALPRHVFLPASLQNLEACLFESTGGCVEPGSHITLIEARSPAEEAREALRWLKARHLRDGVPIQACTVITSDPDRYHPYLRQAAAEMGMPVRFTQGEALVQSPAIASLLALLDLPLQNYPRRLVLDALRSPYFDLTGCGFDRRSADILDAISRVGKVIEGRQEWEVTLNDLAEKPTPVVIEEEDEFRLPTSPEGDQVAPVHLALSRFFDRLEPTTVERSLGEWICWLEDLLDEWHYYEMGGSERDDSAFEALRQTLRALVLGEAVTGRLAFNYAQFLNELQGALRGSGYEEPLLAGQTSVMVIRMMEARGVRSQAVAILGLSEGIFPVVERPDPFLDEELRTKLNLESRLQREQPGLFYQAVTRANRFLLLTRPYLADDGEKWEASPYWKAVLALLPENAPKTIRPDDPRPLNDAASPEETLFWAVRRGKDLPQAFTDLLPRWHYLAHASSVLRSRQKGQPPSPYEGFLQGLDFAMLHRYGDRHIWSVSRLESYGTCPFQFYINNNLGLEAKAEPELGLDAAQLGTILHKILERAYAEASDPRDPQAVLSVLPEIARQVFDRAPDELGFRPSLLWETEKEGLQQKLEIVVAGLAAQDAGAGWYPYKYEHFFGPDDEPFGVEVDGQTILLHGIIDRIDRDSAGRLRIIDYKSGSSHLENRDLIQGRRLQLPIYALAAQATLGMGEVVEGLYWCLLAGKAGSLKLSTFKRGDEQGYELAVEIAREHLGRIVRGIRQAQFIPLPPKGGCPDYCSAGAWCWHYKPGW